MAVDPGLCRRCAAGRSITSGRGSVFWRCAEHDRDPRLPKYPPLPVRRCPFFRPRAEADS
ncbi:MAG: hypothetical protein KC486_14240 [Myxococcales bacterium]|nr:hypothetical protein [Myxococcales bacterium]